MSTQEKLEDILEDFFYEVDSDYGVKPLDEGIARTKEKLLALIDSAKREVLEEMRPANATIESMRMYTPRTHIYMGKEYPACSICGFCPEAMNAFIDAQLEQSEEEK